MRKLIPTAIFLLIGSFTVPFWGPAYISTASAAGEKVKEAAETRQEKADEPQSRLPAQSITKHSVEIGGKKLSFTATVGSLPMQDGKGNIQAEIGFVAYTLDGAERINRPITVAMNGGPGAASAYLNLMAIGPWRLSFDDRSISPSGQTVPVANTESWLGFTDLVFFDPPGTGYSHVLGGDDVRRKIYSVEGDIEILSAAIARWMTDYDRLSSPKFFVGESYGGFRGPLLAEELQTNQGIGFNGLVLVSPVLDFGWIFQSAHASWSYAGLLPSFAAAAMEAKGQAVDESALHAVEAYASGQYLSDLMKGLRDKEAVTRVSEKVAAYTGLDPALVKRMAGRIDMRTFQRELHRDGQEIVSAYDTAVRGYDPAPTATHSQFSDPVLDASIAPLTSAMVDLLRNRLDYKVTGMQYELLNGDVNAAWDWGKGRSTAAESLTALGRSLALDPNMRVLVVHGATDIVTPYFTNRLLLNQLPELGDPQKAQLKVYPGGHMFYSREASRKAMLEDVRALFDRALALRSPSDK